MTNIKEKNKKRETISFKGQQINVGLDVHKKNWSVSIYIEQQFIRTYHQESNGSILLKHLQSNYPEGIYRTCYEAGFCGFSLHRELTSLGIRIKELRESNGVTQEVFYNDTGINIGRIERAINDLSISTLERICDYFNISLKDFLKKGFD